MSALKRVLLAHERLPIARAAERVLTAHGFAVTIVSNGEAARRALAGGAYDGLVVDVALPGVPGYELAVLARAHAVAAVILVASVYRRTSYKRRPSRLYGADDYVEVHHLGDQLPDKLRQYLGMPPVELGKGVLDMVGEQLKDEGDARMDGGTPQRLASLIVADVILYNGDTVAAARSVQEAELALAEDLRGARELFGQVRATEQGVVEGDPIGEAFNDLMHQLKGETEQVEEST